jgi:5-carboxymethyl-2-hydroxymuconate isomerase
VVLTKGRIIGRSAELLRETSANLQSLLYTEFNKSATQLELGISVEIIELNDSYAK